MFWRALAIAAIFAAVTERASAGLEQMEHIIIFMQENRAFDHYFGTLKGVRGFNDRTPIQLRSGLDAFHQPIDQNDLSQYMLPFRTDVNRTNAMCMPAPEMNYPTDIKIWNHGKHDSWNTARDGGYGMAYFTREDLPYYYTLYDQYAVADQYFQSTFTATNPNRMHLFTGSNGLSVGQAAVIDNTEPRPGYTWDTLGEVLERSNVSWRVYQQLDNFDDNAFAWFKNFQQSRPGDVLFDKGMARQHSLMQAFEQDLQADALPQVSIVIAPTRKSEHATNHPCAGEDFSARLLRLFFAHPKVYRKSALLLMYDEGGQFFDHHWSPTPPMQQAGFSSVPVDGEVNGDAPIGLGFRVPLVVVSPWTRGNIVNSQVFDHTSVIQLVERRFGVSMSTISPWRRLVTGDLLSFFDFAHPDYSPPAGLPDTSDYVEEGDVQCHTLPDPVIPAQQSRPQQEPGTRISRALPYELQVTSAVVTQNDPQSLQLTLQNSGSEGLALALFDLLQLQDPSAVPRQYALAPGVSFTDSLALRSGEYAFALHGPNGFLRELRGKSAASESCAFLEASLALDPAHDQVAVHLVNQHPAQAAVFTVRDNAYGLLAERMVTVAPLSSEALVVNTGSVGNWYDLTAEASPAGCLKRRFMGRMETGRDSISDPAMGAHLPTWLDEEAGELSRADPPRLPERVTRLKRVEGGGGGKDARFYPKEEL